jgi:hypothetical protein
MNKNLALFDSAKTTADYQTMANSFERIAEAEKTQYSSIIMQVWHGDRRME